MDLNLFKNFKKLTSWSFKLIERFIIFWNNKSIKPTPNSIAEKTKKKKVNDSILRLSLNKPIIKTIEYKVIHNNSAVNNKCKAVLVFIRILKIIKKKKRKSIFKLSTIILKNLLNLFLKN